METSWLHERKLPLTADELVQALAAKTFKALLSFHLPWPIFFLPNFPPCPVFNKMEAIFYTFLSLIQSKESRLGERATEHKSSGSLTDVSLLPLLLATAATVSAGLGSVFTQIKGTFSLSFASIPSPTTTPNPSSLDWYPLTMTFLHMQSSHGGAVGCSWLSADFRALSFISCLGNKSWGFLCLMVFSCTCMWI